MIEIKVFGAVPPCAKCKEVTKRANKIAAKYPGKISVTNFDVVSAEGTKYGILLPPALVINEKIVSNGRVPGENEIEKIVQKEMEATS